MGRLGSANTVMNFAEGHDRTAGYNIVAFEVKAQGSGTRPDAKITATEAKPNGVSELFAEIWQATGGRNAPSWNIRRRN